MEQDFIFLERTLIILLIDAMLIIIQVLIVQHQEMLMDLVHMELELNLQNVEPGIIQMIIMIVLIVIREQFLIKHGLLKLIEQILVSKMEMVLRLVVGVNHPMRKGYMDHIVAKIHQFIQLKIVQRQVIKLMVFILIINQVKLLCGLIINHIIIKEILI